MVDLSKIKDIITALPLLIIYILPGYTFISIKNFIANKDQKDDNKTVMKSIAISYIIINFETLFFPCIFKSNLDISSSINIVITVLFSVLIGYIYAMLIQSKYSDKVLKILKITRSLKEDMLTELMDYENGMWVRVFLNTEALIYVGKIRRFEKNDNCNYTIALSNCILYGYSGKKITDNSSNNNEWVIITVRDNYRMELVYDPINKKIIN